MNPAGTEMRSVQVSCLFGFREWEATCVSVDTYRRWWSCSSIWSHWRWRTEAVRRDPVQHGCPGSQNWLCPGRIKHRRHKKTGGTLVREWERAPIYLNRYCVVEPRTQAIHVQPPQLIEKSGELLIHSWSVAEGRTGEILSIIMSDKHDEQTR